MTQSPRAESAEARRLYALLDEIDRAGHLRGTASRLDWLRLKAAAGPSRAKADMRALGALLAEIHGSGLIAGTAADVRWQLAKSGLEGKTPAPPTGRFPRCPGTFFFWRGGPIQRAEPEDVRDSRCHEPDGD